MNAMKYTKALAALGVVALVGPRDGTLVIGGIALEPNPELNREVLVFLTPRIVE
jgi:hypothetical protein